MPRQPRERPEGLSNATYGELIGGHELLAAEAMEAAEELAPPATAAPGAGSRRRSRRRSRGEGERRRSPRRGAEGAHVDGPS